MPDPATCAPRAVPIGDAQPDENGQFVFEQGRGGGRMDKVVVADPDFRWRYIQASHFGEVNAYYHLDLIAAYIDSLLARLHAPPLPRVTAVVNAHHGATDQDTANRRMPFQGGHYRLPSRSYDIPEPEPLSPQGEIHLGPGWKLTDHGALVEAAGSRYRANASHNAGILYHEFAHHLHRHTADFRANALRRPDRQDNRKSALDEGTCDYWAATMLGTPHIWAFHHRHDRHYVHPRSLTSARTFADYVEGSGADPHANGTIWGAALWNVRTHFANEETDGEQQADLLVLQMLILMGQLVDPTVEVTAKSVRRARVAFSTGLAALLRADQILNAGCHRDTILRVFRSRGIQPTEIPETAWNQPLTFESQSMF
ncbi:MAG: M36 family metallopeptidase [Planctomycetia bacterium]|nr:M36 family metallopeptidase [Planctomycetia bacterium]